MTSKVRKILSNNHLKEVAHCTEIAPLVQSIRRNTAQPSPGRRSHAN